MHIPDDNRERKRSKTDPFMEPSQPGAEEVTLIGRTGTGTPFEAIEAGETISIPLDVLRKKDIYVLQVKGDAMVLDHLLDGDHLILQKRNRTRDGEMVLALIRNSEARLKRFYRVGHRIRLEPANPFGDTVVFDEKEVVIQGVVVGILRKYPT